MDVFKELPVEQWPALQEKLKKNWLSNVGGYYALYLNMKYPKIREALQFKVFCPDGDIENGFIGTSINGPPDFIIFSVTEDTSKLEDALLKTKLIDWSQNVCLDLLSSTTLQCVERIKPKMAFKCYNVGKINMHYLDRTAKPFEALSCPSDTHLAPVRQDSIQRVDDTWPYKHPTSHAYFSTFSSNGLSYGLYSNDSNELLAWVFLNEYNFLCHLYCEESHRRKGYAEYIVKCVANEQLRCGNDVYGFTVLSNLKSAALFLKLGFRYIDDSAYVYVQK